MERFDPLNDYLFLKIMGEKGDEKQCLAFLNAVLASKSKQPVKLIKILENKTFTAEVVDDKTNILDVRVETDTGEKINIEVQLRDLKNIEKRTLFHWGREYTSSLSSGKNYNELPRVITINIVDFDYIKLEEFHTCFHLWEDDHPGYLLTDVLEVHFISMVKFRKLKTGDIANNALERWLTFLDRHTPEEVIEEVVKMDSAINMAYEQLKYVTQDKEVLRAYHRREMAMSDWTTGIDTATEKGIEIGTKQGIEIGTKQGIDIGTKQGIEIGKIEDAKNMLNEGLPIEVICRVTGLDAETIKSKVSLS
jgi:predicted transposase/invertase (TIGR01784 family)